MTRSQFALEFFRVQFRPGQRQFLLLTGQVAFDEFTRADIHGRLVFVVIDAVICYYILSVNLKTYNFLEQSKMLV